MVKCKWCGASVKLGPGPDVKPEWERWNCRGCGSFGYTTEPSSEDLKQIYEQAWKESGESGEFAAGSTNIQIANSLLDAVKWSKRSGRCLDYGGGNGEFANALAQKGCSALTVYEPYGQDPGIPNVKWISSFEALAKERFEWVFMIEVIEHVLDPKAVLAKIRQFLLPGGRLIITTPNAKGWRARRECFDWREVQNPTHINLFSAPILKDCLLGAGYSSAERIFRPVAYGKTGVRALALSLTQFVGIDGGLRFVAINDKP
ncbi:MAG: class I SAM-dependent methyltransferase [Chromatiaceae bacterium]|nr:class I SAM-dependent methyltransferase [Chromatiaceae bacterium]